MKSPMPGIVPSVLSEVTVKTVWPTIGANPFGKLVGSLCGSKIGVGFFTLGKIWAVVTIPLSLCVYFWMLMPFVCRRYTLTNRRIIIRRGLKPIDEKWIELDEFDSIEVVVLPGQEWLFAGDLVFKHGENEKMRLAGVSRPEVFRQICLAAQNALLSVRKVVQEQMSAAS